jgi:methionyl-tRNA formyltransferase
VACGDGTIAIEELQLEGKKRLPARQFMAGRMVTADARFGGEGA